MRIGLAGFHGARVAEGGKIRSPKSEVRKKSENRKPKGEGWQFLLQNVLRGSEFNKSQSVNHSPVEPMNRLWWRGRQRVMWQSIGIALLASSIAGTVNGKAAERDPGIRISGTVV